MDTAITSRTGHAHVQTPPAPRATTFAPLHHHKDVSSMSFAERLSLVNNRGAPPVTVTAHSITKTQERATDVIRFGLSRRMLLAFSKTARQAASAKKLQKFWLVNDVPVRVLGTLLDWMVEACRRPEVPSFNLEEVDPEDVVDLSNGVNTLGIDPALLRLHEQLTNYILVSADPGCVTKLWRVALDNDARRDTAALRQHFPSYLWYSHTKDLAKAWSAALELRIQPAIGLLRRHLHRHVRTEHFTAEAILILYEAAPGQRSTDHAVSRFADDLRRKYRGRAFQCQEMFPEGAAEKGLRLKLLSMLG